MAAALSILIPTLLGRAAADGKVVIRETAQQLLQLAAADQTAFKCAVASMDTARKGFMEAVLREGGASGAGGEMSRGDGRDGGGEPTIALKMSFGQS